MLSSQRDYENSLNIQVSFSGDRVLFGMCLSLCVYSKLLRDSFSVSLPEYQINLTIWNQEQQQQQQLYFQDRIHEYQMEESIRIQNSCFYFPQRLITVLKELPPPAGEPKPFKCIRLIQD